MKNVLCDACRRLVGQREDGRFHYHLNGFTGARCIGTGLTAELVEQRLNGADYQACYECSLPVEPGKKRCEHHLKQVARHSSASHKRRRARRAVAAP